MIVLAKSIARKYFIPLSVLSYFLGAAYWIQHTATHKSFALHGWFFTQYHINYIDFGFAKRALIGTLFYPVMSVLPNGELGEFIAFVLLDLCAFLLLVFIVHSVLKRFQGDLLVFADWTRIALLISPVGFMQVGSDAGRYDHFNYLLVFLATYFVVDRKLFWAGMTLALGAFLHEAIFFYGLPVVTILALLRKERFVTVVASMLPLVGAMAVIALFGNLDVNLVSELGETAATGAEVWTRGVFEPATHLSAIGIFLAISYTTLPYYFFFRFFEENRLPSLLIGGQMLFICCLFFLGVDAFRWAHLVFFSCLTFVATLLLLDQNRKVPQLIAVEKIALGLYLLPLGPIGVATPLPYMMVIFEKGLERLGMG